MDRDANFFDVSFQYYEKFQLTRNNLIKLFTVG